MCQRQTSVLLYVRSLSCLFPCLCPCLYAQQVQAAMLQVLADQKYDEQKVRPSDHQSIHPTARLSVHPPVRVPLACDLVSPSICHSSGATVHMYAHWSLCKAVRSFIYQSLCLSVCLSVCPSALLYVEHRIRLSVSLPRSAPVVPLVH